MTLQCSDKALTNQCTARYNVGAKQIQSRGKAMTKKNDANLQIRLPSDLLEQIKQYAEAVDTTCGAIVRQHFKEIIKKPKTKVS